MNHENKIPPSLSQASTTHHPYVFTPIQSLSEGRASIAWVASNDVLSARRYKVSLASPPKISLYLCCPSWLSLSLSLSFDLKGLILTLLATA
jgi:hypothetical protein